MLCTSVAVHELKSKARAIREISPQRRTLRTVTRSVDAACCSKVASVLVAAAAKPWQRRTARASREAFRRAVAQLRSMPESGRPDEQTPVAGFPPIACVAGICFATCKDKLGISGRSSHLQVEMMQTGNEAAAGLNFCCCEASQQLGFGSCCARCS